ncbi:MAG TPA: hypothetical protein VKX41_19620 [Alloacidobacterium sp.]|jgi:hypothetical protein|nr:hypothetical protein [Alloacidobacterium sp.]
MNIVFPFASAFDAPEDLDVEDIFDISDLSADGRVCDMHTLGCDGKAARPCGRDDVSQVAELQMVVDAHSALLP